ncbi:uncharacterized protein EKO05_0005788 [Ascochyta rabiei]|uniref:Lipid metabolic process n=1 Tax=Didymella rabiei TaxID=5454 RepID=A0A163FB00_DIDRA|nr:uncharacterized protein EKO05_0005788 [Ascochyta rabiei]KZM24237.1 lipid metabolic process [Ascochyta rabiei]UPX15340.1 hypothetical protein EKO05_0005788 [Ascochyta rabiei]
MSTLNETESTVSIEIPPGHSHPRRQGTGRSVVHGTVRNEFWRKRNLLSLDGGGIRGYWTLLLLKRLMEFIHREEERQVEEDQDDIHSFWPEAYPNNVSQLPRNHDGDSTPEHLPAARAFLLCHYFDFICGSSTGGLIAIMLGRFRMTVDDCLQEYKQMSHSIFGRPRWISQRNIGMPWPKYSARGMKKAFQDVSLRRCDSSTTGRHHSTTPTFPMTEGVSQTFVTTIRRTKNSSGVWTEEVYLIRSYHHERGTQPNPVPTRRPVMIPHTQVTTLPKINYGPAETMEIWQVARAATAAPMYFKEIRFTQQSGTNGQKYFFSDGGFGETNNPTDLGLLEIETLPGRHSVGAIVSVGTSRGKADPSRKSVLNIMKRMAGKATNPNIVASAMSQRQLENYWRFNDEEGIDIELDDWKPSSWFTHPDRRGEISLKTMEDAFHRWACKLESAQWLENCARELVTTRRGRCQEKSRWEQFALGAHTYRCKHEDCCNEPPYSSRHQFEQHWQQVHENEDIGEVYREPQFKKWIYQQRPEIKK